MRVFSPAASFSTRIRRQTVISDSVVGQGTHYPMYPTKVTIRMTRRDLDILPCPDISGSDTVYRLLFEVGQDTVFKYNPFCIVSARSEPMPISSM